MEYDFNLESIKKIKETDIEKQLEQEYKESKESISNKMEFDHIDLTSLNHHDNRFDKSPFDTDETVKKQKRVQKTVKRTKGRPFGSVTKKERIRDKKLTIRLPIYQIEQLKQESKKENRTVSNLLIETLKNIKTIKRSIIKIDSNIDNTLTKDDMKNLVISINEKELNELQEYCKKVNRKIPDLIRLCLRNPKEFDKNILTRF